jgi:hypothetical protein
LPRPSKPRKTGKTGKTRKTPKAPKTRRTRAPKKLKIPLPQARQGRRLSPGIVRLDYDRARGYIVRLSYVRTKTGWRPRFKVYFSDSRCGGKAKALAAAEAWLRTVTTTGRMPKPKAT